MHGEMKLQSTGHPVAICGIGENMSAFEKPFI
jgi:hypothetical protein